MELFDSDGDPTPTFAQIAEGLQGLNQEAQQVQGSTLKLTPHTVATSTIMTAHPIPPQSSLPWSLTYWKGYW